MHIFLGCFFCGIPFVIKSQKNTGNSGILVLSNWEEWSMVTKNRKKRKAFVNEDDCVACGCCMKVCPLSAIEVWKGIAAKVNMDKCVGCGKCAKECPGSVIDIREVAI